ncbi:hypothetical protein [Nocardia sp. CA-120079]|uniref:hypothetical protein n=1 Tax=Nocardia sp. CA-120079 TaxID=3239974 RepID=UPI003D986A6E
MKCRPDVPDAEACELTRDIADKVLEPRMVESEKTETFPDGADRANPSAPTTFPKCMLDPMRPRGALSGHLGPQET